jgi:hypothetical protein
MIKILLSVFRRYYLIDNITRVYLIPELTKGTFRMNIEPEEEKPKVEIKQLEAEKLHIEIKELNKNWFKNLIFLGLF